MRAQLHILVQGNKLVLNIMLRFTYFGEFGSVLPLGLTEFMIPTDDGRLAFSNSFSSMPFSERKSENQDKAFVVNLLT